jgi:hypothetical protein
MQNDQSSLINLDYRSPGTLTANRFAVWFRGRPHWLIALVLLAPVFIFDTFGFEERFGEGTQRFIFYVIPFLFVAVWFIAGAVRRLNWRHVLVMLALAGAWYGLLKVCSHWSLFTLPFPYSLAIWVAGPVVMIGFGEWMLMRPRSPSALIWVLVFSVAVGLLVPLLHRPFQWTGAFISLGHNREMWGGLIYWPLTVVLTWIALPAAMRVGRSSCRAPKYAAAGASIAVAAAFVLFFNVVIYQLAHRSLVTGGPFTRDWAAAMLELRYSPSDEQALWDALKQADWLKNEDYKYPDYRRRCIDILSRRDRPKAARELSLILREKPSDQLATLSAPLLAQERRYEASPELLRFALLGNSKSTEALETLGVPEAALAIIRDLSLYERPNSMVRDFAISPGERTRLTHLLGKDVGPKFSSWTAFYDATAGSRSTPLSGIVQTDTTHVAEAMASYWTAAEHLYEAKCRLAARRLEKDGKGKYLEQMRALEPLMRKQGRFTEADVAGMDPRMLSNLERYQSDASRDMRVRLPDWDVRGTGRFQQEVADYVNGVQSAIASFGIGTSTKPTTKP